MNELRIFTNCQRVDIFVDGSCKLYESGGIGIVIPSFNIHISEEFKIEPLTNQRAELYAIYRGLKYCIMNIHFDELVLHSDSMYSLQCILGINS